MFRRTAAILSADLIGKDGRQRSDNLSARPVQAVSKFCEWSDTGRNTHRTSLRCDAPRVLSSFSGRVPAEVNDGFRYGGDCECSPRFAAVKQGSVARSGAQGTRHFFSNARKEAAKEKCSQGGLKTSPLSNPLAVPCKIAFVLYRTVSASTSAPPASPALMRWLSKNAARLGRRALRP